MLEQRPKVQKQCSWRSPPNSNITTFASTFIFAQRTLRESWALRFNCNWQSLAVFKTAVWTPCLLLGMSKSLKMEWLFYLSLPSWTQLLLLERWHVTRGTVIMDKEWPLLCDISRTSLTRTTLTSYPLDSTPVPPLSSSEDGHGKLSSPVSL